MPELFRFVNGDGLCVVRPDSSVDLFDVGNALFDFGCILVVKLCGVFHGDGFVLGNFLICLPALFESCLQVGNLLFEPLGFVINAVLLEGDLLHALPLPLVLTVAGKNRLLFPDKFRCADKFFRCVCVILERFGKLALFVRIPADEGAFAVCDGLFLVEPCELISYADNLQQGL